MNSKRWLAAYVKMHHEKRVYDRLTGMNIECFLPIQREVRKWSDRKKKVDKILIPMMIFVRISQQEHLEVLQTSSVLQFLTLRNEKKPAVIPDEQMERFRFIVDNSEEDIAIHNGADLTVGKTVRVIKGPLTGLIGELAQLEGKNKIAINIPQLGYASVEIKKSFVEVL
ncbi:MAG TPA: UpxY family transcription antiterminator [Petrimonas sp.]|nr:UpxY family transcription antiterminator [Petrimonas sp.]